MNNKWYNIQNNAEVLDIDIHDEIGLYGVDAASFIGEIKSQEAKSIRLSLNSYGGNVFDGIAIYNYLKNSDADVEVNVVGIAASSASIIAMAGDVINMPEDAFLMIHNPWVQMVGDADELRKEADLLDQIRNQLVNIYKKKTGKDEEDLIAMLNEETWLNGSDAAEMGFVDQVTNQKVAAMGKGWEKHFASLPEALAENKLDIDDVNTKTEFERYLRHAGLSRKDAKTLASKKIDIQRHAETIAADQQKADISALSNLLRKNR